MIILKRIFLAASLSVAVIAQTASESVLTTDAIRALIDEAANARDPVVWAKYLMRADAVAEKLERAAPGACCGNRCVRIGSFDLHFRFDGIADQETYQHDLLQLIAQVHEGTAEGAEALVRLLPTGCQTIASPWTPYFRTVLDILDRKRWKDVPDRRLTKIRAEAYETW